MRKFTLLAAGVALAVGTLAACIGPPPPPPTDPHDVLVVGDSVSFSFGCALGDGTGCPAQPGYTTHNESSGACTITPGTLVLYNGVTAPAPNCNTAPDEQGRTWAEAASFFTPRVVVIDTSGWEVVDRWINSSTPPPNAQWGGPTNGSQYDTAFQYYTNELFNAINMFRSKGAQVLLATSPYFDPPEPVPAAGSVPPGLDCSWWEPYDPTPPNVNNGTFCNNQWRSPPGSGADYTSSKPKMDQLNAAINIREEPVLRHRHQRPDLPVRQALQRTGHQPGVHRLRLPAAERLHRGAGLGPTCSNRRQRSSPAHPKATCRSRARSTSSGPTSGIASRGC